MLMKEIKNVQIQTKLILLVEMTIEESTAIITTIGSLSDTLTVETGVRHDDSLSTVPFNIAMEGAVRALKSQRTLVNKLV